MNVRPLFVANAQPPELIQPSANVRSTTHRHRPSPEKVNQQILRHANVNTTNTNYIKLQWRSCKAPSRNWATNGQQN